MKQAAVGFRVHSGWSALVTVSLENGSPTVLSRERVHLVVAHPTNDPDDKAIGA